MAQFEKMMPFILKWETRLKPEHYGLPIEQMFAQAKKVGYANHPNDSGGPTMCGVTLSTYRAYRRSQGYQSTTVDDLKAISLSAWKTILKKQFWDKWRADQIRADQIAYALVDWMWVSGVWGIRYPQKLLGVTIDGKVGPVTLAAINNYPDQHELFDKIQAARNAYHASIAQPGSKNAVFLNGWNNRVASITWEGLKL